MAWVVKSSLFMHCASENTKHCEVQSCYIKDCVKNPSGLAGTNTDMN